MLWAGEYKSEEKTRRKGGTPVCFSSSWYGNSGMHELGGGPEGKVLTPCTAEMYGG